VLHMFKLEIHAHDLCEILEPLFISAIPPKLQSSPKTEPLRGK
jgi:hypothetical protein